MKENFEQLLQPRIESFQLVSVQPEISQCEVESDNGLGTNVSQRAVVKVESGGRQARERLVNNAHVSVAVDEQMLKCQTVKRPRVDRFDAIVTEIQPT